MKLTQAADYEARDRNPAGDPDLFELERRGLLALTHRGWGHYSVRLTNAGHRQLSVTQPVAAD
jgi:hypothetical protein